MLTVRTTAFSKSSSIMCLVLAMSGTDAARTDVKEGTEKRQRVELMTNERRGAALCLHAIKQYCLRGLEGMHMYVCVWGGGALCVDMHMSRWM